MWQMAPRAVQDCTPYVCRCKFIHFRLFRPTCPNHTIQQYQLQFIFTRSLLFVTFAQWEEVNVHLRTDSTACHSSPVSLHSLPTSQTAHCSDFSPA